MAERKRKHYDDDDDDEMDTVPTRQRNSHGAVYLTSTGAVTQLEMGVSWKDQYLERLFEDSVTFATDFGAQMAVGVVNGRDPNTVYWYRHIGDMEPVEITGWPALDIIGFCVVGDRTDVWIAATQDPELTLLYWNGGSAHVPSGGRYTTRGDILYVWHLFDDRVQCRAVDMRTALVAACASEPLGQWPTQLIPTGDRCNVLRFGAPVCQVLSTGETFVMRHCPYVGTDFAIYVNGQRTHFGSPLGPVPQWIWGDLRVKYLVLTTCNMLTFYSISRPASVDASMPMSLT